LENDKNLEKVSSMYINNPVIPAGETVMQRTIQLSQNALSKNKLHDSYLNIITKATPTSQYSESKEELGAKKRVWDIYQNQQDTKENSSSRMTRLPKINSGVIEIAEKSLQPKFSLNKT